MSYKELTKQREYQRKWIAERRAAWFADKYCVACSSTERLELDHIDPSTKVSNSIWSWSQERRDLEIAKCQVLCNSCHVIKSREYDWKKTSHGSGKMYNKYGCRCTLCRESKKVVNRKRYL